MTENEATRELKSIKSFMKNHGRTTGCDFLEIEYEALNMAIQALEEIQQYREIAKNKHIGKDNMVISSSDLMTILNSDSEKEIRAKAIEEFAERLKENYQSHAIDICLRKNDYYSYSNACHTLESYIDEITEEMRGAV